MNGALGFVLLLFGGAFVGVGGPRWLLVQIGAWSRVARMAWKLRAERRRRDRARRSADLALAWEEGAKTSRSADLGLGILAVLLIGAVVAVLVAGCGGVYPLEPSPDAGADAGPPPCAAPAGHVVIAHGCDCASDPLADSCATETAAGADHQAIAGCRINNGEHCISACAECSP